MEIQKVTVDSDGWATFHRDNGVDIRMRFRVADTMLRLVPTTLEHPDGIPDLLSKGISLETFERMEVIANTGHEVGGIAQTILYSLGDPIVNHPKIDLPITLTVPDKIGKHSVDDVYTMLEELGETGDDWKRNHSDQFYKYIASLYWWHAIRSDRPNADIAERLDLSVGRVRRWVSVCREKGYIRIPARVGKAG